jgi:UDP-N-acetylglucosamine:LPS N-acetylglucosamine transferase
MSNTQKKLLICLVASAGGHITQLLKLRDSWKSHKTVCVTTVNIVKEQLCEFGNVYTVGECNREHPLRTILVLIRCINVILHERPNVVVSTGAAVGCIVCFLGRLFGARVVWIDSITNIGRISLSGRMVRHIADLFLVQWPELAEQYSNVQYVGTVI